MNRSDLYATIISSAKAIVDKSFLFGLCVRKHLSDIYYINVNMKALQNKRLVNFTLRWYILLSQVNPKAEIK